MADWMTPSQLLVVLKSGNSSPPCMPRYWYWKKNLAVLSGSFKQYQPHSIQATFWKSKKKHDHCSSFLLVRASTALKGSALILFTLRILCNKAIDKSTSTLSEGKSLINFFTRPRSGWEVLAFLTRRTSNQFCRQ